MTKRNRTKINYDIRSTTHNYKDRVTRTPLKTGGELMWSGRTISSYSTSESVFIIRRHFLFSIATTITPNNMLLLIGSYFKVSHMPGSRHSLYTNHSFWGIVSPIEKIPLGSELVPNWVNSVQLCWRVVHSQCSWM